MVDGNFQADYVKIKNPEDDIALADGLAFIVEAKSYKQHLKDSIESNQMVFWILYKITFLLNINRNQSAAIIEQLILE